MKKILSLKDIEISGKKVIVRTAFDVPLDSSKNLLDPSRVSDASRIEDSIPTLDFLISKKAKIILAAGWLGRPKGEDKDFSMAPVALKLQEILKEKGILKHNILLTPNCLDGSRPRSVYRNKDEVARDVSNLKEGQIMLLENVRYDSEANANDENFARFIASLAGKNAVYVNEAEAQNHRPEATIVKVPKYVVENGGEAVFGFKYAEVIKYIGNISKLLDKKDRGPFIFFLSGKKIETQVGITSKISATHSLLDKMRKRDIIIVSGAVTYTFLLSREYLGAIEKNTKEAEDIINSCNERKKIETEKISRDGGKDSSQKASDNEVRLQKEKSDKLKSLIGISDEKIKDIIGNSFVEWKEVGEQIFFAAQVLLKAKSKGVEVLLSNDHTIADCYPDKFGNLPETAKIKLHNSAVGIPKGWIGVAPGAKTLDCICDSIRKSYLLILAGPLSIEDERVENFSRANFRLFNAIKEAKERGAFTIAAGGDTAAIVNRWGGEKVFTLISNAGGATLELIEKGTSPGIKAVYDSYLEH